MSVKKNNPDQELKELKELKESLKSWQPQPEINISSPYTDDTITLSSLGAYTYSNAVFGGGSNSITGSISAANGPYTLSSATGISNPWATSTTSAGKLKLEGENADIEINGVSLMSILQERLNVLIPNPEIESEWEELKRIGDEYRKVEADIKEKIKMWNKLKSSPKVNREEW